MSTFKTISIAVAAFLILAYFIYPNPKIEAVNPTQLPWHIALDENNNSTVFGLKFQHDTLQQAMDVFGEPETIALYADTKNPSIEVYFGSVKKAGLSAKVIVGLSITPSQANEFLQRANSRMQSNAGIPKIELHVKDRAKTADMMISSLTYMPLYSGLETEYLLQRFGKPSHQIVLSESATQFFYAKKGLSLISDTEGKEVFQYTQPALLVIPQQASVYE